MKRLFGTLSSATLVGVWLIFGVGVASRLITDRYPWVQYAWWVPSWVYLLAGGGLVLAAFALKKKGRVTPAATVLALVAATAYFAVAECFVTRMTSRPSAEAPDTAGGLRILFWNPSVDPKADVAEAMNLVASDLAIMVNPSWNKPFNAMASRFGPAWFVMADQFIVLSRYRVSRWAATDLGLHGRLRKAAAGSFLPGTPTGRTDAGRACWLELDTTALLGRPIFVWVLDLPSDEQLSRWDTAGHVATLVREWTGQAHVPDGRGGVVSSETVTGFPQADIVIGDLNSPRGSASFGRFAPGMHNAFDEGGVGCVATFPRGFPVLHIDHVLLAPWLTSEDYRVVDPGASRHRMVWTRLRGVPAN